MNHEPMPVANDCKRYRSGDFDVTHFFPFVPNPSWYDEYWYAGESRPLLLNRIHSLRSRFRPIAMAVALVDRFRSQHPTVSHR